MNVIIIRKYCDYAVGMEISFFEIQSILREFIMTFF